MITKYMFFVSFWRDGKIDNTELEWSNNSPASINVILHWEKLISSQYKINYPVKIIGYQLLCSATYDAKGNTIAGL